MGGLNSFNAMENHEKVLEYISKKQNISQRELAAHTGLSLGNINLIIGRMVKKGLIKIERLKPNTIRYILTPQGFAEKTAQTYRYIRNSVRYVLQLKQELTWIMGEYAASGYGVYLYGDKDEIREVLIQLTAEGDLQQIQWVDGLEGLMGDRVLVIVWQVEREMEVREYGLGCVNLLERVG